MNFVRRWLWGTEVNAELNKFSAITCITLAATLWAVGQISWRYGEGGALALAGQRALIGVLLMLPVVMAAVTDGRIARLIRHRDAMIAVLTSASTMPFSATLFRELTGPQAALMTAVTPAAVLIFASMFQSRTSTKATIAVLVSTASATVAAVSGGLGDFAFAGILSAAVLVVLNVVMMIAMERARSEFDSGVLIGSGMVVATVACYGLALAFQPSGGVATSGLIAATVTGVVGTMARVLRAISLPQLGAATATSSTQLTALLTGVGGVFLFDDVFTWWATLLGVIAAGAAVAAALYMTSPKTAVVETLEAVETVEETQSVPSRR